MQLFCCKFWTPNMALLIKFDVIRSLVTYGTVQSLREYSLKYFSTFAASVILNATNGHTRAFHKSRIEAEKVGCGLERMENWWRSLRFWIIQKVESTFRTWYQQAASENFQSSRWWRGMGAIRGKRKSKRGKGESRVANRCKTYV